MKKIEVFKPWIVLVAVINADLALTLLYNHLAGGKVIAYLFTIIWLPITGSLRYMIQGRETRLRGLDFPLILD